MNKKFCDFLVIGSGVAGLMASLKAATSGKKVMLVTKKNPDDCNTALAQGGVSCVIDKGDSFVSHVVDTLDAGGGVCDEKAVQEIVCSGPERIAELISFGVDFDKIEKDGEKVFELGKEGGHSHRRILHAGDISGREIFNKLFQAAKKHPNIEIFSNYIAIDLIVSKRLGFDGENSCLGAYILEKESGKVWTFLAKKTILATGGAGKVYLYTTNPNVATGDGIAMGYRAYTKISNMEFFQFHPTVLYHPKADNFLISEALRGEGAILKICDNGKITTFMNRYHSLGSLAPRDIVARAIDKELKRTGEKSVYLDISHHSEEFLKKRFPNIFQKCLECGINMARDLIPVVPAAHYCCGGIATDVNGNCGVKNLYAIGETACTGLHGGNRLASNSLLEAVVTACNSIENALQNFDNLDFPEMIIPDWNSGDSVNSDEEVVISHNWQEIRQFMWDFVGVFRTDKRLQRAKSRIQLLISEIEQYYWNFTITSDLIELRNLATVAKLIIDSAIWRNESCGLHFNADKKISEKNLPIAASFFQRDEV